MNLQEKFEREYKTAPLTITQKLCLSAFHHKLFRRI